MQLNTREPQEDDNQHITHITNSQQPSGPRTGVGVRGARQMGQVECWPSQASMHFRWNSCPQGGSFRSSSPASYSPRHTLHASSPLRPDTLRGMQQGIGETPYMYPAAAI